MTSNIPDMPFADHTTLSASMPATTREELNRVSRNYLGSGVELMAAMLHSDHGRNYLDSLIEARVAALPPRPVYVIDFNRLRVNGRVVSQRSSRFGMWIGAAIGFVLGVLVTIFYQPGTVDVTDTNTLQVVLTTILTPLWGKCFFVLVTTAIGLSTGAPFDKPRQDIVHDVVYVAEDNTEYPVYHGGYVPARGNN